MIKYLYVKKDIKKKKKNFGNFYKDILIMSNSSI